MACRIARVGWVGVHVERPLGKLTCGVRDQGGPVDDQHDQETVQGFVQLQMDPVGKNNLAQKETKKTTDDHYSHQF